MSEINTYKVILHPGWLLIVPSSKLPFCALGFTVWRGRVLFLLKVTCLHLNNIPSASILFLLENNLLNLTTPWVTGRNTNPRSLGMRLLVLEQTLSSRPYFSSSSITIYITWFPRTPPPTHTHTHCDKRPLWFRESRQG